MQRFFAGEKLGVFQTAGAAILSSLRGRTRDTTYKELAWFHRQFLRSEVSNANAVAQAERMRSELTSLRGAQRKGSRTAAELARRREDQRDE
jgi:hypothetical protein